MKTLWCLLLLPLLGCSSSRDAEKSDLPPTSAPADGKLAEAAALGKKMADYPPSSVPPKTRADAVEETLHGESVKDPYRWLEDEKNAEVQAWMKAQDAFAREHLATLKARPALLERYKQLYYLDSVSPPVKRKGRLFYMRTFKDKEKAVLHWRAGEKGEEKVLLDPNTWSKDGTVSLGVWEPSWDGKKVAFSQKPNAADEAVLHVIDVDTGEWSKVDVIEGAKYAGPSWTPDNLGFYYEWLPVDPTIPVAQRPGYTEIRYHKLGSLPKWDLEIREKTGDPTTFLNSSISRDGRFLFVSVDHGWNENELFLKRMGQDNEFTLMVKGKENRYQPAAWKNKIYVSTDDGAPNGRIFVVDPAKPLRKHWKQLIAEDKGATLSDFTIVGGHLALTYLRNAVSELKLFTLAGKPVRTIELPGLGTASNLIGLQDDDDAYFAFSSFTNPRQVMRTSVKTGVTSVWSKVEVPIDPTPYTVSQVWYPSKDGTRISMFLVHKKEVVKDGSNPVLLYGYGGFNVNLTSSFSGFIYPWLEAGGIYAVPNLRGGAEYGSAWHDAGKLSNKQRVFEDFIGAAEYLIAEKYTQASKLAIKGGSNGGLLVGAAMVQRPELFGAVLCGVPLLDMVRYHKFGSGSTWISEYGSADKPEDFKYLYAYSPYHQVKPGVRYPPLLMMSADHDDRVDPMHARKFVAAVQAAGPSANPAYLRIEGNSGHGGADQVAKAIELSADQLAYLFRLFGMGPTAAP